MKVIVNVEVEVDRTDDWNFKINDALRNVGHAIYMNPQYVAQKGDGTNYTFEYNVSGRE